MNKWFRNCPKCDKKLEYGNKKSYQSSVRKNNLCMSCSRLGDDWIDVNNLKRNCPECGKEHIYSNVATYKAAIKNNSLCKCCMQLGEKNSRYGIKLSDNHKLAILEGLKNTKEYRVELAKLWHKNNPGNNINDKIRRKYGDNIDDFLREKGERSRGMFSGELNPMYGKPSPQGSGNGWSGWYLDHFFRSLIELSYMVEFLSASGCIWESAETNKFKIEYTDASGQIRNYFPDFFVNNKYLVEIKPKNLFKSESVKLKKEAAEKWCKENGYEYLLIEPKKLCQDEILRIYNSGEIKFTDRYEQKFKERYLKENNSG